jgi:S-formylglutathione hydrolase FrmB
MRIRVRACVIAILLGLLAVAPSGAGASRATKGAAGPVSVAGDPAHITAEKLLGPRAITLTISTPAFAAPTHVDVDLPTGYSTQPRRRWPVTYILAGIMNTYSSFNDVVDGLPLSQSYPSIIVSPNGDSGWWSDWYNAGAFGPPMYETFVIDQLLPLIDANYRTIANRAHRAIAGISMGGYGAMMLAAEHPDLFGYAASLSGADDTNITAIGAVLSLSPTFQNAPANAIYGPRSTEEIRWRGHNPTDLADNLRGLDIQIRTANGIPDPAIGESGGADTVSCLIEAGVHQGSVDLNAALTALGIPHLWDNYGPGCHTPQNFERELRDTFQVFTQQFAHPPATPTSFNYESIQPSFDIWGWHVTADPRRALEVLQLQNVSAHGLTLIGSGTTTVTTAPLFHGVRSVTVTNATPATVVPTRAGRITVSVDLGPADSQQEYTSGAVTSETSRTVTFTPHRARRRHRRPHG